ncbi:transposon TX1 [Tanacetum coccineum]
MRKLWMIFKKYGTMFDMFMAQRRLHCGLRYGFVRYKHVNNVDNLLHQLQKIKIEDECLRVYMAYDRKLGVGIDGVRQDDVKGNRRDNNGFADLVNGGSKKGEEGNYDRTKVKVGEQTNYTQKNNSDSEKQWGGRCIDIEESEINVEVIGRSVVGEVKALCFLAKLPVLCKEQGLGKVEVKILGSLEVLVVMENESTAKKHPKRSRAWDEKMVTQD